MPRFRHVGFKGRRHTIKVRRNTTRPRHAFRSKPIKINRARLEILKKIDLMDPKYHEFIQSRIQSEKIWLIRKKMQIDPKARLTTLPTLIIRDFCIVYLYHCEGMSADEIKEKFGDFFINHRAKSLSRRGTLNVIRKYNLSRSQEDSMFHRAAKGRMHYESRSLKNRVVDYVARDKERGYLWANGLSGFLIKKGDISAYAIKIGCDVKSLSAWKNLRHRVSIEYQKKICNVLKIDSKKIFSEIKAKEVPKLFVGAAVDHRKPLIERGYRYATYLKEKLYQKGISTVELAKMLGKPQPSVSRWGRGLNLVSPKEQDRVAKILELSKSDIFTKPGHYGYCK